MSLSKWTCLLLPKQVNQEWTRRHHLISMSKLLLKITNESNFFFHSRSVFRSINRIECWRCRYFIWHLTVWTDEHGCCVYCIDDCITDHKVQGESGQIHFLRTDMDYRQRSSFIQPEKNALQSLFACFVGWVDIAHALLQYLIFENDMKTHIKYVDIRSVWHFGSDFRMYAENYSKY